MTSPDATPSPRLETERLVLRLADANDVEEIVRYFQANREFLRPFDPLRPESFFQPSFWSSQARQSLIDSRMDRAVRFFLFTAEGGEIVGTANFTQMQRGVSQSCTLGYGLAEEHQGKGFMREALEAAIEYMFRTRRMHRIEANYMPHNVRSGKLLRRLGFVVHGYARDYLLINGGWEDHVLTGLINPEWQPFTRL
ncbi:ribosomal protein S5-alanine N-acetyltransferase [soil metagenome]